MANRRVAFIVKEQPSLMLAPQETVQVACQRMWERRVGAVLVRNEKGGLVGIFTGRDAVRTLAEGRNPAEATLAETMTAHPDAITAECTAIDALRMMSDGGYRHLPVVDRGVVIGIVSREDFKGLELDRLEEETILWERIA
jgi:CBS domain-containing protein